MANEKRLIDDFRQEIMSEFIEQCQGNDFNRLTLLEIGETIDRIYRKYGTPPTVDAVEVVRCMDCKLHNDIFCKMNEWNQPGDSYCSYGERRTSNEEEQ